jgi:putative phosphoribosyl transferase
MIFGDRKQAGKLLAERLERYAGEHPIILGLPRGGVPVAYEVAQALHAPLDVIIVRKLGVPFQPELGMGAIGEGGVRVLNDDIVRMAHVSETELAAVEQRERAEVERRAQRYRRGLPMADLRDRTVIVVDDGIATGGTARAALQVARAHGARNVILAVPVAAPDTVNSLRADADEIVVIEQPENLVAIGYWYRDFRQTSDSEVERLLELAARSTALTIDPVNHRVDTEVEIPLDGITLAGHLSIPEKAEGIVIFAHGSGSSRHSPRNRSVASMLQEHGIATLLFDLLSEREANDRSNVFDIELLANRLAVVTRWLHDRSEARNLKIGYFGASTGAAAALYAAAEPDTPIAAVVSRGGRPDLAIDVLGQVKAPTLLIVGSEDDAVLELNLRAAQHLRCEHRVEVVPGATHLFEEPGTLMQAATLAQQWFAQHFHPVPAAAR